ncbi:MAG: replication initiator protein A [Rubrobacteraceae bacterium]|nr:replication initiator protein A [Rubrobacteraceae bacterium]
MSDLQWPLFPEYTPLVSAEQNLEEFPLFELKARKRGVQARVFEKVIEGEAGVSLNQVWKVMPSGEYGMPGPVDQDVYLAVLQLQQQRGGMPENGELSFSLYELRKILGWSDDSGGAYKEIRDALLRIATTSMQSRNAFYSAEEQRRIVDTFNIWSVHFAEHEVKGQTVRERHVLKFHPIFIRNYIAQYLKGIDSDFYWSLRSPVSKRLYRLVDLQRAGGLSWETDLFGVRDQIPLDYNYPSQIKRALQKAHDELLQRDFLSGVEYEGKTEVVYKVSRDFARRQKARALSGDPKEIFAIERLIRERIDGDTARELVVTHGPERCLFYADAVNHQKGVLSRAGWIVSAIKGGWAIRDAAQTTLQDSLPVTPVEGTEDYASPRSEQGVDRSPPPPYVPPDPDPAAEEVWEQVLQDAEGDIDISSLRVWFDGISPIGLEDSTLSIAVPNSFAKEYIETRFKDLLESSLKERLSKEASLRVVVGAQPER